MCKHRFTFCANRQESEDATGRVNPRSENRSSK